MAEKNIRMFLDRPHWSSSSIQRYLSCSLAWSFKYAYGIEPEHTPAALVFGRAFHAGATWMAAHRGDGREYAVKDAGDFFGESFKSGCRSAKNVLFDGGETPESADRLGRWMLERLSESWPMDEQVLETGAAFCVPLASYAGIMLSDKPLIGEYDALVRDGGGRTVIVDWKTAARKWPADKAGKDLQATCYLYAYTTEKLVRLEDVSFRFDVLTKAKNPEYEQHPTSRKYDDFGRLLWLVQSIEKAVKAEAFVSCTEGWQCNGCVYVGTCREWHRQRTKTISLAKAS